MTDVSGYGLNPPELSRSLKPGSRAITSDDQLEQIVSLLVHENDERNRKNSRIMQKYNAERPYDLAQMQAEGVAWSSNFSSQPLATLIDRIAPRFTRAIDAAKFLTSAKLPDYVPGADKKTETYRREFTKLCRDKEGWRDLVSQIAQENALFGFCEAGYSDEFEWFPEFYRQDEFFVPAKTKQIASKCPILVRRRSWLLHEVYELIRDRAAAERYGWDIPNTIEAINAAMPQSDTSLDGNTDDRRLADLNREASLSTSLSRGAREVLMYDIFVAEVTGKVSHYTIDGRSKKRLFGRDDQFESMADVSTFFSFQQANGLLQGSKGVGRTVYALANIVDRSRNEVVNRLQLSGKVIVQGDDADIRRFKMNVVGAAMVIGKQFQVQQTRIEAGVEPFIALDNWTQRLMDELAGNVSPAGIMDQLQGERVTNGQVNLVADLANEAKDVKIERFVLQFARLLSTMQRRASSKHVRDQAAKDFRMRCLREMSEKELDYLANQPAANTIEDLTEYDRSVVLSVTTELAGNPLVDQKKVLRRKLTAAVDAEFAEDVLLPDEDPNLTAEQDRLARMENILLQSGQPVSVSARDNFQIHTAVLMEFAQQIAGAIGQDMSQAPLMQAVLQHGMQHVQVALNAGTDKNLVQPVMEQLSKIEQGLRELAQAQAQAEAQAQQQQVLPPGQEQAPLPRA